MIGLILITVVSYMSLRKSLPTRLSVFSKWHLLAEQHVTVCIESLLYLFQKALHTGSRVDVRFVKIDA